MALGRAWWPGWLPLLACLAAAPSRGQHCSVEKMDSAVIDIRVALSRGVRGAEPAHTPSAGACARACCSGPALPGDKKCNLMVFDARRTSTHPNCYLFYCPSAVACPMKPAIGLVSYKITRAEWVTTSGSTKPRWRGPSTPWPPAAVSSSNTTHVTLLSSIALPTRESPGAFQNTHQGFEPSDSQSYLLEGLLRREDVIRLGEKSGLVAALFLGVTFLLSVIVLTGKKVHESLQKRRYTRLDYLINGMYADV
ncbi:MANSC domain-containing protein 1 [Eudromia elegans]